MPIERICLLGLGEAGLVLAQDLLANSDCGLRLWDQQIHQEASPANQHWQQLAGNNRVEVAACAAAAANGCQLVMSVVTADQAVAAAQSILPSIAANSWYIDFNSVSPVSTQQLSLLLEQVPGRFVEATIMSPISAQRSGSPILLSGPWANDFIKLGRGLGFSDLQQVSNTLGTASAAKMCRSVIIKGLEALVTESLVTAQYYGVEDSVLDSLNNLFPRDDWPQYAHYLISRSLQHGSRRAAEMREVAKTVNEAGLEPWMSQACSQRQDWASQFQPLLAQDTLPGLLNALQSSLDHPNKHPTTAKSTAL